MSNRPSSREVKEALALHRQGLKAQLWKKRGERSPAPRWRQAACAYGAVPVCPYCGEPITVSHDCVMHEVFIKRGNLPIKIQIRIMHEHNCILAHYCCHEKHGQTREFKLRCATQLFRLYGRDTIVAWAKGLGLKQSVEIPLESEEE